MKAIITVGISASGKSTFAAEFVAIEPTRRIEINRDNIRRELVEKDGGTFTWAKWNWKREKEVTEIVAGLISYSAFHKFDAIISDTNLNAGRRKSMIDDLKQLGYEVEIKEFPITLEEAWKRDAARKNGVGHSVIASQYEQWLEYLKNDAEESFRKYYVRERVADKPKCILVDIDGTLAHMNGKRGAFEWDKVGLDDVDEAVKLMVNLVGKTSQLNIIVLSGRDGVCEDKTRQWLTDNGVTFDHIIMRTPNDMRKDTIVKEEIFWRDIADNYNVQFVIDDRPSVCRMWRELGLKVFQVGNPHVEF